MNEEQALVVVRMLADGVDPVSEEEFPTESPYQHPRIVRAMLITHRVMEEHVQRRRRQKLLPANAGKPWSGEEDRKLAEGFDAKRTIRDLAGEHERYAVAIQARLIRLGKLAPEEGVLPGEASLRVRAGAKPG